MIWWVVIIGFNAALGAFAFRLRRRKQARLLLRRLALAYAAMFILSGVVGIALGLSAAHRATIGEFIDPSQKARILAEGISEAMNCAAFGFVVFLLPTLTSLVLFLRAPRPPDRTPAG
jgi:hypothetical protein